MADEQRIKRRRLLKAGLGSSVAGLTGCLRFGTGGSGSNATATGSNSGSTTDAAFEFEYDAGRQRATVRYTGGGRIPAGNVHIQSTAGESVLWPQLGTTTANDDEVLTPGSEATVGPTVLNWDSAVEATETIRVVYDDGSPTTLARFSPAAAETDTRTAERTDSPAETERTVPSVDGAYDGFEDGTTAGWTPAAEHTSTFEASRERAFAGSWSAKLSQGSASDNPVWERVGEERRPTTVQTAHALANGEIYADSFTEWRLGETTVLRVNYNWSNNFCAVNGRGARPNDIEEGAVVADLPWPASDRFFHVVLDDIDWAESVVGSVRVNGAVRAENVPFFDEADGIDRATVFIGGNGGNVMFVDDTTVPTA
ncbi:hypothetical protein [Haloarcula marina]|uniref:hypothetical protein n=1 Tax=Haloarcula marina TaxID=2961574 RepID=UPI0020B75F14|nr:hypothetical protein [Halomicroarcula marina]